jgi:hypothetical protein
MQNPNWIRQSSPQNPGKSKLMRWIGEHLDYQGDDCLIWPFGRRPSGYGLMFLSGHKSIDVHRYICIQVHGEPPSPKHHASHSCGQGHLGCVNPKHVRWKTQSENLKETFAGNRPHRWKLVPSQVLEIRAAVGKENAAVTAARFGVTEANIRQIQTGKNWKDGSISWRRRTVENSPQ